MLAKRYRALPGQPPPQPVVAHKTQVRSAPLMGDPDARLQVLLPDAPACGLPMSVSTFQPGASLPQVEMHAMEHGLLMLAGAGILTPSPSPGRTPGRVHQGQRAEVHGQRRLGADAAVVRRS